MQKMTKSDVLDKIGKREVKAEDIAEEIIANPDFLPEILYGISSETARIRFKSAKILRTISEKDPNKLYSKIDFFVNLLDSKNKIIKWNAMDIIANLTIVDTENRFDEIFDKYYGFLNDGVLITATHVVDSSGKIAKAKPHLTQKITDQLLKLETIPTTPSLTQECKNVLQGKAILAFGMYFDQIENKDDVFSFAKRQLNNTRNATRKKAEKFLKKFESV